MAWTEQCKVAFHANCTAKLGRYKNKNRKLRGVLKELAKESGISWLTLRTWWYEQTGDNAIGTENGTDKKFPNPEMACIRCGANPVEEGRNGKPRSEDSKYYGLCTPCIQNQKAIAKMDRTATPETGIMTVCPHCESVHYVFDESKYNRKRGKCLN